MYMDYDICPTRIQHESSYHMGNFFGFPRFVGPKIPLNT